MDAEGMDPLLGAVVKGGGSIIGKLAAETVKTWADLVRDYNKNIKNFKRLHELLVSKHKDIKKRVEDGERRGEEAASQVKKWLDWAEELLTKTHLQDIADFNKASSFINHDGDGTDYVAAGLLMDEKVRRRAEKSCFKLVGWNPKFRHHLSLKAKELANLIEERIYELDGAHSLTISTGPPSLGSVGQGDFFPLLESRVKDVENIMKALKSNNINRIGIHGMGGAGKTTLANEIARRADHQKLFKVVVILEVSRTPNIKQIQDGIAERIGLPLNGVQTIQERALHLYNRFKYIGSSTKKMEYDNQQDHVELARNQTTLKEQSSNSSVLQSRSEKYGMLLMILDNLWSKQDLRLLGIGYDLETDVSCKVMVISRQEDLCKQMGVSYPHIYKVGDLNVDEAELLFKEKVGDTLKRDSEYEVIMKKLMMKCSRLPLSITILANSLKNQDIRFWESMDKKLEKRGQGKIVGVLSETYSIIKMSYNNIDDIGKQRFFLLCCLFPPSSDLHIVDLLRYGIGLGLFQHLNSLCDAIDQAQTWVEELKSLSLLLDIDGEKETIKIHDDVREAGQYIAMKDKGNKFSFQVGSMPEWIEKKSVQQYSAVTMASDDNYNCLSDLHLPHLRLLRLQGATKLSDDYFLRMPNVKVLDLAKSVIGEFPSSIGKLSSLQTLLLEGCVLDDDVSWICKMTTLQVLSLKESHIRKLPEELGNLVNLKVLDLTNCGNLIYIPVGGLGKLTQLEGLFMKDSFDDWEVEGRCSNKASISELRACSRLQVLEIKLRSTKQLVIDDDDFPFSNLALSSFKISIGVFDWHTPNKISVRRHMQVQNIAAVGDLTKQGCKNLLTRVESLLLRELDGSNWSEQDPCGAALTKSVPEYFFGELKFFCLFMISGIEYALPTVDSAKALEVLQVQKCKDLKHIVCAPRTQDEIEFPCMINLILESLPSLRGFCEVTSDNADKEKTLQTLFCRKARFPSLERLHLDSIENIEQLWDMTSDEEFSTAFSRFKTIEIISMPKLKHVWRRLQTIHTGEEINHLEDNTGLESMREDINHLEDNTGRESMRTVSFSSSVAISCLQWLTNLEIKSCNSMKQVIFSELTNGDHENRSTLCFPNLLNLECWDSENLVCFHNGKNNMEFPALTSLKLKRLENFESFIKPRKELQFVVDDGESEHGECYVHERVNGKNTLFPSGKAIFVSLQELVLESLDSVELLWDDPLDDPKLNPVVVFPRLQKLQLKSMSKLKYVWSRELIRTSCNLPNLVGLEIDDCRSIECVCPPIIANDFLKLQRLEIINCPKLKQIISTEDVEEGGSCDEEIIPNNIIRFPTLSALRLEDLTSLACFYQGLLKIEFLAIKEMLLIRLGNLRTFVNSIQYHWIYETDEYNMNDAEDDYGCPRASLFFREKVLLHSLKTLCVDDVGNIETIWDIGGHEDLSLKLPNLEVLFILRVPKLRTIWSGANTSIITGSSKELKIMCLMGLPMIEVLAVNAPNGIKGATKIALFNGKFEFPLLEDLRIINMANFEELLGNSVDDSTEESPGLTFPNLKKLGLASCPMLQWKHFPQTILNNLKVMTIIGFPAMKCLFSRAVVNGPEGGFCVRSLSMLKNLEELIIESCELLEVLFEVNDHQNDMFLKMKILKLKGLCKLRDIPWYMLPDLQSVELYKCQVDSKLLISTPNFAKRGILQRLERLNIMECDNLETVVMEENLQGGCRSKEQTKDVIEFPLLKEVEMSRLPSLYAFSSPHCEVRLPSLKSMKISYCYSVGILPFGNLVASNLKNVDLDGETVEVLNGEELNRALPCKMGNECKVVGDWPRISQHPHHVTVEYHPLNLRRMEGLYICDACKREGAEWSYYCYDCHFELHVECVLDKKLWSTIPEQGASSSRGPLMPPEDWPKTVEHPLHVDRHTLKLTTTWRSKKCVCKMCYAYIRLFSFSCPLCGFDAHPECVLEEKLLRIKKLSVNQDTKICYKGLLSGSIQPSPSGHVTAPTTTLLESSSLTDMTDISASIASPSVSSLSTAIKNHHASQISALNDLFHFPPSALTDTSPNSQAPDWTELISFPYASEEQTAALIKPGDCIGVNTNPVELILFFISLSTVLVFRLVCRRLYHCLLLKL